VASDEATQMTSTTSKSKTPKQNLDRDPISGFGKAELSPLVSLSTILDSLESVKIYHVKSIGKSLMETSFTASFSCCIMKKHNSTKH